jgi:uncharacterized phage protein (TIGR01671 family)
MLEIEFRGKCTTESPYGAENGDWVFGNLVHNVFCKRESKEDIYYIMNTNLLTDFDCFEDLAEDYGYYEVDADSVGQYTGLKDRNDVKIFEGDIVSFGSTDIDCIGKKIVGVVKWDSGAVGFSVFVDCNAYDFHTVLTEGTDEPLIVIGNIHDNPELLEVN